MTPQEIFDTVMTHLSTQGRRAYLNLEGCRYRTDTGLKCAVGCLISDDEYRPNMEGIPVSLLGRDMYRAPILRALIDDNPQLLQRLQDLHDTANQIEDFIDAAKSIADDFTLDAAVIYRLSWPRHWK